MSNQPLIDPAIEAIARDADLSDALKQQLIGVAQDTAQQSALRRDGQQQFAAQHRRGRWSTPLWVALTGLITLGGNFAFDHMRAEQASEISQSAAEQDAQNDRTIARDNAKAARELQEAKFKADQASEALRFQYEVIKNELTQFKTQDERADSLRFLLRAGVLGPPVDLAEINKMIEEGNIPALGDKEAERAGHVFRPCDDASLTQKITLQTTSIVRERLGMTGALAPMAAQQIDALQGALASNGVCGPEQLAMVLAIAMFETNGFETLESSVEVAKRFYERNPRSFLGDNVEEAVKYRGRGMSMVTGKFMYETFADRLRRPDILERPEIILQEPAVSAALFVEHLKMARVLEFCKENACDVPATARRINVAKTATDRIQAYFDVALLSMLE